MKLTLTGEKYKRFLVAGFDEYYPTGFDNDIIGSFETLEEVILYLEECKNKYNEYSVYDSDERVTYYIEK